MHLGASSDEDDISEEVPLPPDYSPDPFAPDPTIFPPPPPWLFPLSMTLLAIGVLITIVMLLAWWRAIQYSKAERAKLPPKEWVDLSQLGKGGRWADSDEREPRGRGKQGADDAGDGDTSHGTDGGDTEDDNPDDDGPDDPDDLAPSGGGPRT